MRKQTERWAASLALAAFTGLALGAEAVNAQAVDLPVPEEIYGRYAPAGNCARLPRVDVGRTGVHLETPAGKSGPLPVSVCFSCAGGAQYAGLQRWVYVKYGKNRWGDNMPVILMFNAREQRGLLEVSHDDTLKTPLGAPMTAVVRASPLKRCSAGAPSVAKPKGKG
ncbi:MAG: hypothetical protein WCZ66_05210 [Sphingomonadaceae bacterium]